MATSLECRVPLLDYELVELAAQISAQVKVAGGRAVAVLLDNPEVWCRGYPDRRSSSDVAEELKEAVA